MKVRLTEEKLKSIIKQCIKESNGKSLWENYQEFQDYVGDFEGVVYKVLNKIMNGNFSELIDGISHYDFDEGDDDRTRLAYLEDLLTLLDKIFYAEEGDDYEPHFENGY